MNKQHLTPVFNPNIEAHAMQALNAVMMLFQTAVRPLGPESLVELDRVLSNLVDCLFPIEGNNADIAGYAPLPAGQYVHPIKTAEAAVLLGRAAGMPRSKLILLGTAAALMNVGYLLLKQSLIDEPRRLMDGEWEQQVHTHPALSVTALTSSGLPHEAIVAIGQHHERWDGSGYPHGVRGDDICMQARILAIADTFISLRSERPYRAAMATEQALQVIASESGRLYEPSLVDAFTDVIRTYGEKEERKATGGAAAETRGTEAAAEASRGARADAKREEFAQPRRSEDTPDTDDVPGGAVRSGGAFRRQHAAVPLAPAAIPVTPAAPAMRPPTASTDRRARTPRSAPGAVRHRRRRSLYSTDVYVRAAASGEWLD